MKILIDTADVETIQKYNSIYHLAGVTTNPSIIAREGKPFWKTLGQIREAIGNRMLHVQVTAPDCDTMCREADTICSRLGRDTYIKVPVTEQGVRAIRLMKEDRKRVTATAVYSLQQAMLAACSGADYCAPYFNRMANLGIDSKKTVEEIERLYRLHNMQTKVLGASFKNIQQVMDVLLAGSDSVTVAPELLTSMCENPIISSAVSGFHDDWVSVFGNKRIFEL